MHRKSSHSAHDWSALCDFEFRKITRIIVGLLSKILYYLKNNDEVFPSYIFRLHY